MDMDNDFTLSEDQLAQLDDQFEDLVEGGSQATQALKESLSTQNFGSLDVSDFTEFQVKDFTPTEGTYHFACEQKWLQEATSVVRLIASVGGKGAAFGGMKVTVYKGKLRLSAFNQAAFCEIFVPLHETLGDLKQEVSFIFNPVILAKIASSFGDAIIGFTFYAEKGLLEISSGNTKLELSTASPEDFVDYHSKLEEPKLISKVDPEVLRHALSFTSSFVKRDEVSGNLSLVDVREGYMVGGTYANVGLYQAKGLDKVTMKIKYEVLGVLEKLLGRFHETNTHLFDVGDWFMLRDENLYLGFEKSQFDFPPVTPFLQAKYTESVLVQRSDLVNSLNRLSVVSTDKDMMVHLEVEGLGKECKFRLSTQDMSGRRSVDSIAAHRTPQGDKKVEDLKPQSFYVNLHTLLKVAQHFATANMNLKLEESGKILFVADEDGDRFQALTAMVVVSESQYQKIQEDNRANVLDKAKKAGKKEEE